MKYFDFNKTINNYFEKPLCYNTIILLIFFYCILINERVPKVYVIFFNNLFVQVFLFIIMIIMCKINKLLAVYFILFYSFSMLYTFISYNNYLTKEEFLADIDTKKTNSNNNNNTIVIEQNRMIGAIINDIENVSPMYTDGSIFESVTKKGILRTTNK